jgi:predicted nucleotidyltransferase
MNENIKNYIRDKLEHLEKEHNVTILHAIESGSRAWGFPSKDSDYDVRFIYVHPMEHYLSIDRKRDVVETPILHDDFLGVEFDMSGWDIKKALGLAIRGNVVVHEWMTSPIIYQANEQYTEIITDFLKDVAKLESYFYAYRNKTYRSWIDARDNADIRIKDYCYSLRCALCIEWVKTHKTPPPMDLPSLLAALKIGKNITDTIDGLITMKEQSSEKDTMKREPLLDNFIDSAFTQDYERPLKELQENENINIANELFLTILEAELNKV